MGLAAQASPPVKTRPYTNGRLRRNLSIRVYWSAAVIDVSDPEVAVETDLDALRRLSKLTRFCRAAIPKARISPPASHGPDLFARADATLLRTKPRS